MPTEAEDPAALVTAIVGGDTGAEERLVERYQRGVTYIVRRVLRSTEDAEDVFQETFQLILTKLRSGELREPSKLSGFVSSVARNHALGRLRRTRRQNQRELPATGEEVSAEGGQPLTNLLRREKAITVRRLIGEMKNERDRRILYSYYLAEEPKDSICIDLGLTTQHFNRVLHRARRRYRELWEEDRTRRLAAREAEGRNPPK